MLIIQISDLSFFPAFGFIGGDKKREDQSGYRLVHVSRMLYLVNENEQFRQCCFGKYFL